jgi:hypothetical protein
MNPFYDQFKLECVKGGGLRDEDDLGEFYRGSMYQRGYGLGFGEPFIGNDMCGYGLGQTLSNLFQMAWPLLKRGMKFLGTSAVGTVADIARDVIEGKNVKESAKERVTKTAQDILAKAPKAISEGVRGSGAEYITEDMFMPPVSLQSAPKRKRTVSFRGITNKRKFGKGLMSQFPLLEKL